MSKKGNLIILVLLSLPLFAYSQSKNTYHISGFIDNSCAPDKARLNDGDTVTLSIYGNSDKKVAIHNNSFSISDTITHPGLGMISTDYCGHAIIVAPGDEYSVTFKLNKLEDGYCYSNVLNTSSEVHNKWIYYTQYLNPCYTK